jgi:Family of unknown function (DUF5994)
VDSAKSLAQRSEHKAHVVPTAIYPMAGRRRDNPVRLCVARELGRDIDGAWWPRADRIANELPALVGVLTPLLGDIVSINVNWPPLQRPPDLNWRGWEHKRQHVMTISGWEACVNLLVIPYATHSALALMVLRLAADLPINSADRDKPAFVAAGSIVFAAQQQCAASNAMTACPK